MMHRAQRASPRVVIIPHLQVLPSDRGYVVRRYGATVGLFGHHERAKADALADTLATLNAGQGVSR